MTRAERAVQAADLRAQGLSLREIAARTHISTSYTSELIDDPTGQARRDRARARKAAARQPRGRPAQRAEGPQRPTITIDELSARIAAHTDVNAPAPSVGIDPVRQAREEARRAKGTRRAGGAVGPHRAVRL